MLLPLNKIGCMRAYHYCVSALLSAARSLVSPCLENNKHLLRTAYDDQRYRHTKSNSWSRSKAASRAHTSSTHFIFGGSGHTASICFIVNSYAANVMPPLHITRPNRGVVPRQNASSPSSLYTRRTQSRLPL